jgi:hypothetical protein
MVPGIMRSEQNLVNDDRPLHPLWLIGGQWTFARKADLFAKDSPQRHFETRKQRRRQRVVGLARELDGD